MKKVLVPIDGSECSNKALEQAKEFTRLCNCEVILIHVDEDAIKGPLISPSQGGSTGIDNAGTNADYAVVPKDVMSGYSKESEIEGAVSEKSEKILSNGKSRLMPFDEKVTTVSMRGDPANVIIDYLDGSDIDMVIMGSSGKSGLQRFLIGSVSNKVAKSIKQSILIVR
jgi:nucleotide-binding universal stress UspA family protein